MEPPCRRLSRTLWKLVVRVSNWGDEDIQPAPLKLECVGCGRSAPIDNLRLCDQCRAEHDADMAEIQANDNAWEDDTAKRIFYNG